MPLGSQALNLKLNCCIGIVSHDPVPLAMKAANFRSEHGGAWAFLWRNLGGIDQDFRARLRIEKTPSKEKPPGGNCGLGGCDAGVFCCCDPSFRATRQ